MLIGHFDLRSFHLSLFGNMYVKSKKRQPSKLDNLLKAGATRVKQQCLDIDKVISSTTHRLLKEKIEFTKSLQSHDSSQEYKNSGFIILEPAKEAEASVRVCQRTINSRPLRTINEKSFLRPPGTLHKKRKSKRSNKYKPKEKT